MSSLAASVVLLPAVLGAPSPEAPTDGEVREFLVGLAAELGARDARAIVRRLDPGALAERVRRRIPGAPPTLRPPELEPGALESAFILSLSRSPKVLLAKSHEVASVVSLEGSGESLAVARYWAPGGLMAAPGEVESAILRWRIRRSGEGLRIIDVEDVPSGVELSLEVWLDILSDGSAVEGRSRNARTLRHALHALRQGAMEAAASSLRSRVNDDVAGAMANVLDALRKTPRGPRGTEHEEALSALRSIPDSFPEPLSPGLSSLSWLLASIQAAREERWTDVLVALRRAEAGGGGVPLVALHLRSLALNALGRHEAAVSPAREYLALAGEAPESCLELGRALLGLDRREEALRFFRRGLERDFDSEGLLLGLARALPESRKEELRGALRKASAAPLYGLLWKSLVETLLDGSEAAAASIVVSEAPPMEDDDYPPIAFHVGRILAAQGSAQEAAEVLEKTLASESGDVAGRDCHDAYLEAMKDLGKPLDGYRRAEDKGHAFRVLAGYLDEPGSLPDLEALVREHERNSPDDPWLLYHKGLAAMERHDLAAARRSFEKGLSLAGEDGARSALRRKLVLAYYKGREGLEALDAVVPLEETFEDLALLHCSDGDGRGLENLLEAYRRKAPVGGGFHWWEADLCQHEAKYDVAAVILIAQREKIIDARGDPEEFERKLVRCLVDAGRDAEALEEARRSTARGGDPWLEVFVHARAGRIHEAVRSMAECVDLGFASESDFFGDEEIGAALSREAFRLLREAHSGE